MSVTHSWRDLLIGSSMVLLMMFSFVFAPHSAQGQTVAISEALKSAVSHTRDHDTAAAIEVLEEALPLAQTPERQAATELLLSKSYIWAHQNPDRAIELLEKVLEYDPEFEYYFALDGGQLREWRDRAQLQEWLTEKFAAWRGPTKPSTYHIGLSARVSLGDAYYWGKGDKAAGLREWEIALEKCPEEGHALQANVYRARQELGLVGALDDFPPLVVASGYHVRGPIRESSARLLVSAAELSQRLALVAKPGSHGQVELASHKHNFLLSAGSRQAVLDGATITLPVAPVMVNGKMLIPLRFVSEALGYKVIWEALPRIAWVK